MYFRRCEGLLLCAFIRPVWVITVFICWYDQFIYHYLSTKSKCWIHNFLDNAHGNVLTLVLQGVRLCSVQQSAHNTDWSVIPRRCTQYDCWMDLRTLAVPWREIVQDGHLHPSREDNSSLALTYDNYSVFLTPATLFLLLFSGEWLTVANPQDPSSSLGFHVGSFYRSTCRWMKNVPKTWAWTKTLDI